MPLPIRIIVGLLLVLGFSTCTPLELPPAELSSPVFSVNGTLDGQQLNIAAGVDNYFLHTKTGVDPINDLRWYEGKFDQINCADTDCPLSLRVRLYAAEAGDQSDFNTTINQGFQLENAPVLPANPDPENTFQFTALASDSSETNSRFQWNFGDGSNEVIDNNPQHIFAEAGSYQVCLDWVESIDNQLLAQKCETLEITPDNWTTCGVDYTFDLAESDGTQVLVASSDIGTDAQTGEVLTWGDSIFGPRISIPLVPNESTLLQLSNPSATCLASTTKRVGLDSLGQFRFFSTQMQIERIDSGIVSEPAPQDFRSRVVLEWLDENGQIFSSVNSTNGSFQIIEHEAFEDNADGLPTHKITARIDAELLGSNSSKQFSGELVFAVALPQ